MVGKTIQPIKIFERTLDGGQSVLTFNNKVQKIGQEEQKILNLNCLPNMSFFATRGRVNMKMEHVDKVRDWIHNKFMPLVDIGANMNKYGYNKIKKDNKFVDYLVDFMHLADFNISGLENNYAKEQDTANNPAIVFEHTVENDRGSERYNMSFGQQSEGTKRMIGIEAAIYEAVEFESFLTIDEIESSLHPDLLEYVLQKFLMNHGNSQLLVTTHYPGLLDTINDLLRKDNIWFVEKGKNGSTDLYSLVEFNGLNKIPRFERAYRSGRFGALPNIKD